MTPKEKARDLITKFQHPISEKSDTYCLHIEVAKEFALIAVDEIIEELRSRGVLSSFWYQVRKEIEKL